MTPTFPPSAKELPFGVAILHHFKGGLACFREFGDDLQVDMQNPDILHLGSEGSNNLL